MIAEKENKFVAVFAGSRDHYQVPHALAETDRLATLVTDFYTPDFMMRALADTVLGRCLRLARRRSRGLVSGNVTISWPALFFDLMSRLHRSTVFVAGKDAQLGKRAGRIAARGNHALLAYSYYASYAFESVPARTLKVIFQVHPHADALRRIYAEEIGLFPGARASIEAEAEMNYPVGVIERLRREAKLADFVITPSSFAKSTLVDAGVDPGVIAVVPYGISTEAFRPKTFTSPGPKLRLIFIGSMIQRKGLGYLLEAMRRLKQEPVELVLVGRGVRDEALIAGYRDVSVRIVYGASQERLLQEMTEADVFVLPSLAESFALVILEAMAVGLPVITTTHTAGPDILKEGRTGFVGNVRDVDFLADRIRWFLRNRQAVADMGRQCQREARGRTWAEFRRGIRAALDSFEQQGMGA